MTGNGVKRGLASAQRPRSRWQRLARLVLLTAVGLALLPVLLILVYRFVDPMSALVLRHQLAGDPVRQQWVPLSAISPHVVNAVVASEDARFCAHHGVDWGALRDQAERAIDGGEARGASTLTMQTVKNLFLWSDRSYVRKGLEIPLALVADFFWSKRRTLEIYLNIAEWGEGIYGIEAAAQAHFGKPASALSGREAARLATSLPNPIARDPARPGRGHSRHARTIAARAAGMGAYLGCLVAE